jgi:hypothetical protein
MFSTQRNDKCLGGGMFVIDLIITHSAQLLQIITLHSTNIHDYYTPKIIKNPP